MSRTLDILFLQDTTGSQSPYIKAATDSIADICSKVAASKKLAPGEPRVGLIAYRDHPPQDSTYVTQPYPFTADIAEVKTNLSKLQAAGGGDGPEAVSSAMAAVFNLSWRADAAKMVVLITDAPPHGIGEPSDQMVKQPDSTPETDPLALARKMSEYGITLFLIACEPTLSTSYVNATDFYRGLVDITSGAVFPLLLAERLAEYIIGSVLETVDIEGIIDTRGKDIARRVLFKEEKPEELAAELYKVMLKEGITIDKLTVESIYRDSPEAKHNLEVWSAALDIIAGRALVKKVEGPRLLDKFLAGGAGADQKIELKKEPISLAQTKRIIKQSVMRNADVGPGEEYTARPSHEPPKGSSITINIPPGWFAYISSLSRVKYNQLVRLRITELDDTNTEYFLSEWGQENDTMKLRRTREGSFVIASSEEPIKLELSFYWSTEQKNFGPALEKSNAVSNKLRVITTETPMNLLEDNFPDYSTFFILAEDHPDSHQVAGVPDYNDSLSTVNLIRSSDLVIA